MPFILYSLADLRPLLLIKKLLRPQLYSVGDDYYHMITSCSTRTQEPRRLLEDYMVILLSDALPVVFARTLAVLKCFSRIRGRIVLEYAVGCMSAWRDYLGDSPALPWNCFPRVTDCNYSTLS
jgi:hypothetical protein